MRIPVIVTDIILVAEDAKPVAIATFKTEAGARRVINALKGEQASGHLVLDPGQDFGVVDRPHIVEADAVADAKQAGYAIDEAAIHEAWELIDCCSDEQRKVLGLAPKEVPAPKRAAEVA